MHTRSFRRAPLALALLCAFAGAALTACKPAGDDAPKAAAPAASAPAATGVGIDLAGIDKESKGACLWLPKTEPETA